MVGIAALMAVFAGAGLIALGANPKASAFAALVVAVAVGLGYAMGRGRDFSPDASRLLMFRVVDELAQYRAFTRLLRDQGDRIVETTSGAVTVIVSGLREMDASVDRLRALATQEQSVDVKDLLVLVDALGAPVMEILGQIQFQDVTQQQIAFLSRLSLILDQHMLDLANLLGDRRSMDRLANFKDMFNRALEDCVMTSQREDHHAATGLDQKETSGPKIEIF